MNHNFHKDKIIFFQNSSFIDPLQSSSESIEEDKETKNKKTEKTKIQNHSKIQAKTYYGDFFPGDLIKIANTIFTGQESLQHVDTKVRLQHREVKANSNQKNANDMDEENLEFVNDNEKSPFLTEEER